MARKASQLAKNRTMLVAERTSFLMIFTCLSTTHCCKICIDVDDVRYRTPLNEAWLYTSSPWREAVLERKAHIAKWLSQYQTCKLRPSITSRLIHTLNVTLRLGLWLIADVPRQFSLQFAQYQLAPLLCHFSQLSQYASIQPLSNQEASDTACPPRTRAYPVFHPCNWLQALATAYKELL